MHLEKHNVVVFFQIFTHKTVVQEPCFILSLSTTTPRKCIANNNKGDNRLGLSGKIYFNYSCFYSLSRLFNHNQEYAIQHRDHGMICLPLLKCTVGFCFSVLSPSAAMDVPLILTAIQSHQKFICSVNNHTMEMSKEVASLTAQVHISMYCHPVYYFLMVSRCGDRPPHRFAYETGDR